MRCFDHALQLVIVLASVNDLRLQRERKHAEQQLTGQGLSRYDVLLYGFSDLGMIVVHPDALNRGCGHRARHQYMGNDIPYPAVNVRSYTILHMLAATRSSVLLYRILIHCTPTALEVRRGRLPTC